MSNQDIKRDDGKPDYTLLPLSVAAMGLSADDTLGVVLVREHGVRKYGGRDGWQQVESVRLRAAAERHRKAILRGEYTDPESGLPHRHHYLTNIAFLMAQGIETEVKP